MKDDWNDSRSEDAEKNQDTKQYNKGSGPKSNVKDVVGKARNETLGDCILLIQGLRCFTTYANKHKSNVKYLKDK